ncbi:MAG: 4-(cytidine 5'-diphospho)-2-C-methyl-D-erythritol kinase [Methylomicrobium sp.]
MLRIVGQREDGYHLLQTVFQFIDLCDWLTFSPLSEDKVVLVNQVVGVEEQDNLTYRAAQLLRSETGYRGGIAIKIEKNLPMGGGLGGGSSDAATTLVALNEIWKLGLSREDLIQLGLKLGADVPVFVFGSAAWAEGIGEILQSIEVPEKWFVVIRPDCHVNTKEIFLSKELTRDSKSIRIRDFIAGQHQNDCIDVVRKLYPLVNEALNDLAGYSEARLTGTGSCVFAEFEEEGQAKKAYVSLQSKWQSYLCKGMNRSPLYLSLEKA